MCAHLQCRALAVVAFILVNMTVGAAPIDEFAGERMDAADIAPGVVETMAEVIARDADRSEQAPEPQAPHRGEWVVPPRGAASAAHSGEKYVINKWGDPSMGLAFPQPVDVLGVFVAGQAAPQLWATGLRAVGYRDGVEVLRTAWFENIGASFAWFAIDFEDIDRLVLEARPGLRGAGWYKFDDLAYRVDGAEVTVLTFEDLSYRATLSGSTYAGIAWEEGTGDFNLADALPPPRVPPGYGSDRSTAPDPFAGSTLTGVPPTLLLDFQGVIRGDAGQSSYPPDTCGAIGPHHFVEIVNRNFAVYEKETGQSILNVSLTSFHPGSSGDPRVLFDSHSGRWITLITDFDARIFLGISLTDDPTGGWFKTNFVISSGSDSGCFPDYPTLGVNDVGIYTSAYMVGCGMSIVAIDKAPLLTTAPTIGTITAFRGFGFEGAIQPVITYGDPDAEYFVSAPSNSTLRIRRIVGPGDAPALQDLGLITVASASAANDVPALGSTVPLDSVDTRIMNAVYRDGSIWAGHTIASAGRAGCRWYELDPATMSVVQQGTVTDPVLHYFFPALAVNSVGHVVMGFTGAHAGQYAGAYYTGRRAADPPGTMAPPVLYRAGAAAQNNIDGYGRNRWGDYSLTTLDPTDELSFWTIQEYAHDVNIWGTHIAQLSVGDCNLNNIDDEIDIASGTSADCNANLLPDECESMVDCQSNGVQDICDIAGGASDDCTGNGIPDECEPDCNGDGAADSCDVAAGTSMDCNGNRIPDECDRHDCCDDLHGAGCSLSPIEQCVCAVDPYCCSTEWDRLCVLAIDPLGCGACSTSEDCNLNTIPDECDTDCNTNGTPDECDLDAGTSADCDESTIPDECEGGCNHNGVPDECDVAAGSSADCNGNGVPDECEGGCNGNAVPDVCDLAAATSLDCNDNGVPDECEGGCNHNTIPDACEIATVHNCCATQHGAGCDRPEIAACVCAHDAYCCSGNWDRSCTLLVENGTCGACPLVEDCNANAIPDECEVDSGITPGNCCASDHGAGCSDPQVEACVCALDDYCCEVDWDSICAEFVTLLECGSCGGDAANDCNTNGTPDDCESFADCDGNAVPDECDPDCNANGAPDACDLNSGASEDDNDNGVPDECEILHVDVAATGNETGLSWADAFTDLQAALARADVTGVAQEVWIAAGTYVPQTPAIASDPRTASFVLVPGVDVYGGFAGTETNRAERDPAAHVTRLSGERGLPASKTDNVHTVVTGPQLDANTVIDGLTITGGYSADVDGYGAGMLFDSGNPTIRNCRVVGNQAMWGGGLFVFFGSAPIEDCTFIDNFATEAGGGAFLAYGDLELRRTTFAHNISLDAFYGGGGLLLELSDSVMAHCRFIENSAPASAGGGIASYGSDPLLIDTVLQSNTALSAGGGMLIYAGAPTALNCIVAGNRVTGVGDAAGGGLALYSAASATLVNCAIVNNRSEHLWGGIYYESASVRLANSILWDNEARMSPAGSYVAQLPQSEPLPLIDYSCVQGYTQRVPGSPALGEGIIDAAPRFLLGRGLDGVYGTDDDNFRLSAGSPCIDAGDSDVDIDLLEAGVQPLPPGDFDGAPRIVDDPAAPDTGAGQGAYVDLGPFEYQRDCNSNGVIDSGELAAGTLPDCNTNGQADACDISDGLIPDCDDDGTPDPCALEAGLVADCNVTGVPDGCELAAGTAADCDGNAAPDTCDSASLAALIVGPEDQFPCEGEAATFTISVPTAQSYTWYRNGIPLSDGGSVSGATTSTLTIDPTAAGDTGDYHCVVTDGCIAAGSAVGRLDTAAPAPVLTLLSPPAVSCCAASGCGVIVMSVAVDDPTRVSYAWSKDGLALVEDQRIRGTTTSRLEIRNVTGTDGGQYICSISSPCMVGPELPSVLVQLTLLDPLFVNEPQDVCAVHGTSAVFSASVAGSVPFLLRWYEGSTLLSNGGRLSGVTTNTLTLSNVQAGDAGRKFRIRALVPNPLCSEFSRAATLYTAAPGGCPACLHGGDMDDDGDYDLFDAHAFMQCFGADEDLDPSCACANVEWSNTVVDFADWWALEELLDGPK